MSLNKELYRALEDVLGPENVSDDPVITYSYVTRNHEVEKITGMSTPMFEAVTLPENTEQVQAIVKLCNKYKIQYKAASTGWGPYGNPCGPDCIRIDLRRMNRIIEINEKSMYAVVEPYVLYATLHAECIKRGLNCNITGAGSNCSALPLAAHANLGQLSVSGSWGERNLLAFEWVTPDGEIVRAGSLDSLGEWFSGDGPGPSLRGLIRGDGTPLGGLGVYTKAAQKLYHWPGPSVFPVEGISPHYHSQVPPNFFIRYYHFPSSQAQHDAMMKIGESEIAFILMGFNISMITSNFATSNSEEQELAKKYLGEVQGPGCVIIIAGNSSGDLEYKKEVLQQIVEAEKGKSLDLVEDPSNAGGFIWRWTRPTGSIREVKFRAGSTGVGGGTLSASAESYPLMHRYVGSLVEDKIDLIKRDLARLESPDPFVLQLVEHGHGGHGEFMVSGYDNPESRKAIEKFNKKVLETGVNGYYGVPTSTWGDRLHDMFGPRASNYHLWLRKVKKTFDPNEASEPSNYISAKENRKEPPLKGFSG